MSQWFETATNVWYAIFAISFVLLMVASGAQTFGAKWAAQLVPLAVGFQLAWVVPFILYMAAKFAPVLAASYIITSLALVALLGIAWIWGVIQRRRNL